MNFRHFLDFKDTIGRIEISEPFGFDGSTHKVEQGDNYGRDVVLGDEEIDLEIERSHFEPISPSQQLPNGVSFDYASQGYEYFIDVLKNEGWEAEIEYILEKDSIEFSKGIIDGLTAIISFDSVKFKVIQNTKREETKRRLDISIDAFSSKDLDDNDIEPCVPIKMLMKAKPINQESEWVNDGEVVKTFTSFGGQDGALFSPYNNITLFGIEDTTTTFSNYQDIPQSVTEGQLQSLRDSLILVRNQNRLSNTKVVIKGLSISAVTSGFGVQKRVVLNYGTSLASGGFTTIVLEESVSNTFIIEDKDYEVTIPNLDANGFIWVQCSLLSLNPLPSPTPISNTSLTFSGEKVTITTTSTAIDSVVNAVRYIDLLKHAFKSVGVENVVCPTYDIDGEHYNNFAFNGYLIGQITDKPFNNTLKSLLAVQQEINNGYQLNPDNVECLHYDEFYKDTEIGAFIEISNLDNTTEMNTDLALKTFDFNYKNSSKERETNSEGSIDDIHGTTQWLMPSKKTDENLKIELDHIRSAFLIETQRKRTFDNESTTSLSDDNKLFLVKAVAVNPSRTGTFTARLLMSTNGTQLKIIANGFRWDLLGFQVGSIMNISGGENTGGFFVTVIEPSVLTMSAIGVSFNGYSTITLTYPINDVSFINQTNEGFTLIEGVSNSDNYSNLEYSIGRNLKYWYSYIGACGRYLNGLIKNTLFEINGNLVTQKIGETESISDSGDINLSVIKESRKVEPRLENVTVFADFNDATTIFEKVATDKGFIRVQKVDGTVINGFTKTMEYKWQSNELIMKLQPKKESEFYYLDKNIVNSFQINNNLFVSLYDVNDILIVTPLRFNKIVIDGVTYDDEIEFSDVLTTALE
jgi:hypothetical protein